MFGLRRRCQISLVAWICVALVALALPGKAELRPPAAVVFPVAKEARLAGDRKQTRFVVDLDQKVDMRAFTLPNPYRVVIDLPQINFQLPKKSGERGRGLIKAFRYGLVMPGGSRIVVDTTGPVRVERAFVLDPADGLPARLVLDLSAVDRETFLRAAAIDNRLPRDLPYQFDTEAPAIVGDPRPIIVLDPGHGGIDNGTRAPSGEEEKTLVLDFALALRDKLEQTGKYRVVMTRSDDRFVELGERVKLAREREAQLFISIHCDALRRRDGEAEGATIYTLSDRASDSEAAKLAEAENKSDLIAGVDLSHEPDDIADILIDLAQRETNNYSTRFARVLVSEMKGAARMHKHPFKSAGFKVLTAPDVPSVLIELGYVSSPEDMKQLTSQAWRVKVSERIVDAVHAFFRTRVAGSRQRAGAN
ncbi:MAG: N-acetylmuramoyl-L-alanine amidase [Xanthobacteraceae bacterium]